MAIKNTRKSILENPTEDRLKAKLKENYNRFVTEAEDDDLDLPGDETDDLADDNMDMDMGGEGDGEIPAIDDTDMTDMEGEGSPDPMADLSDADAEQVDAWVDELLGDSLEQVEIDDDQSLDTEMPADSLDPMGDEQFIHDDMPMTVDKLQDIIDSDDSLGALGDELSNMAKEGEEEGDEEMGDDVELATAGLEDEDELHESDDMDENVIEEAEDPFKGLENLPGYEQGYEGEDVKDELMEDVDLAKDNTDAGFEKVAAGLNDKMTSKVKPTPGARTEEDLAKDAAGVVKESVHKSKMLIKAAKFINEQKREIEKLKLENYRLIKANGLLSVAGDALSKEARTQISEAFDKCGSIEQVNNFYNKLTEKIKLTNRPTLNESVMAKKTVIRTIKENAGSNEEISQEQLRKNMLMGLNTDQDMYFQS